MRYFAEQAQLPSGLARNVAFEIADGRFAAVTPDADPAGAQRLAGLTLPGFANCHSHAFHRALRGRTHHGGGTFWTWRERMYAVAERLNPQSYYELAHAVYAEMALAGITSVGEFHYLHHGPGGVPYADPNAMAEALRQAARDAGIRLTLLDAAYLAGGLDGSGHLPPGPVQRRFSDGSAEAWAARVEMLRESPGMRIGAAVHSVRAVPKEAVQIIAATPREIVHVHLSEQPAENEACLAHYGCTPTELLHEAGLLAPAGRTAVHATHLTDADLARLQQGVTVCMCPTTERDLADGIGPARTFSQGGAGRLSLGSDQNAIIDLFEEARALELDERLRSLQRGRFTQPELLAAMTAHDTIGWPDAGRLEVGARADLVAVRLDTVRTAGCEASQAIMAAASADVHTVVCDGVSIVVDGRHRSGDVAGMLTRALNG
ncbi:formimidoylglutamate deiminase [Jatrophihabitans sp.]|uniref:formimidoylglutamate deiminase n=1 Tax=Jatrophihabitans sp. TaxID=1932789 RepID=UPI0030C6B139|nr:N-formimino-L-glutamate deiminase [Jatrophihabitans sp.]